MFKSFTRTLDTFSLQINRKFTILGHCFYRHFMKIPKRLNQDKSNLYIADRNPVHGGAKPVFIECGSANSFELSPRFANLSIRWLLCCLHLWFMLCYEYNSGALGILSTWMLRMSFGKPCRTPQRKRVSLRKQKPGFT